MTSIEQALRAVIRRCHEAGYRYIADVGPDDDWKSPDAFHRDRGGDCEDWAHTMIVDACREAALLDEDIGAVVGTVPGGGHAWIQLGRPARRWCEPIPGSPILLGAPWRFDAHTPHFYRRFEPGVGFTDIEWYRR